MIMQIDKNLFASLCHSKLNCQQFVQFAQCSVNTWRVICYRTTDVADVQKAVSV